MPFTQTRFTMMAAAPLSALATLGSAAAAQCGPERFDYGPTSDPFYAAIVLEHHGPSGPLLPPPGDYVRAQRDVQLIRASLPALAGVWHETTVPQPPTLSVHVATWPDLTPEIICANEYYGVKVYASPFPLQYFSFEFPAPINPDAIAAVYLQLPGITTAEPQSWACVIFPHCCPLDRWAYEVHASGVWRWVVHEKRTCYVIEWVIEVTESGVVSLVSQPCYADCDASGALDFFDFLCFQNQFAAWDPRADCDRTGRLDFFDFLCFQNAFAAGCP